MRFSVLIPVCSMLTLFLEAFSVFSSYTVPQSVSKCKPWSRFLKRKLGKLKFSCGTKKLKISSQRKSQIPHTIEILTYLDATLLRMDRKKRNIRLTDSVYLSDCEKGWRQWLWFEGRKMLIDHHKRRLMTYSCSWIIIYFNKSVHLPLK